MAPELLWWGGPDGLRLSKPWFVYLVGEGITVNVWYPFTPENARQAARPFDDLLIRWEPSIPGVDQSQRNGAIVPLAFDVLSQTIEKYLMPLAQKGIDFDFEVSQGSHGFADFRAVERSCRRKFDIQLLPPPLGRCESVCYRMRFDGLEHVVEILLQRGTHGTHIYLSGPPNGLIYTYVPWGGGKDLKEEQRAYESYFEFCALRLALLRGVLCQVIEEHMGPTKPAPDVAQSAQTKPAYNGLPAGEWINRMAVYQHALELKMATKRTWEHVIKALSPYYGWPPGKVESDIVQVRQGARAKYKDVVARNDETTLEAVRTRVNEVKARIEERKK